MAYHMGAGNPIWQATFKLDTAHNAKSRATFAVKLARAAWKGRRLFFVAPLNEAYFNIYSVNIKKRLIYCDAVNGWYFVCKFYTQKINRLLGLTKVWAMPAFERKEAYQGANRLLNSVSTMWTLGWRFLISRAACAYCQKIICFCHRPNPGCTILWETGQYGLYALECIVPNFFVEKSVIQDSMYYVI